MEAAVPGSAPSRHRARCRTPLRARCAAGTAGWRRRSWPACRPRYSGRRASGPRSSCPRSSCRSCGRSLGFLWQLTQRADLVVAQLRRLADDGPAQVLGRLVGLLDVPEALAWRPGRIVRQQEVLAQREARVVGRHVDAAQVAVALEDDAEHVVGLALGPLRAL